MAFNFREIHNSLNRPRDDDDYLFTYNMMDLMRLIAQQLGRLEVLHCLDKLPGLNVGCKGSEFVREVNIPSLKKLELPGIGQSAGTPSPNKVFWFFSRFILLIRNHLKVLMPKYPFSRYANRMLIATNGFIHES
jgi:hypothetical protein